MGSSRELMALYRTGPCWDVLPVEELLRLDPEITGVVPINIMAVDAASASLMQVSGATGGSGQSIES
jgi:hypothetical protein